uniref:Uncharacterized protein n=1 Tax=Oryza sativa subsp. japonica TaxID=39947 RepID=Q6H825_ORYSJ|nr:hypothetical protein [Oryza sativa Japonica Group]
METTKTTRIVSILVFLVLLRQGDIYGHHQERYSAVSDLAGCGFEKEGYPVVDYESDFQTAMSTTCSSALAADPASPVIAAVDPATPVVAAADPVFPVNAAAGSGLELAAERRRQPVAYLVAPYVEFHLVRCLMSQFRYLHSMRIVGTRIYVRLR